MGGRAWMENCGCGARGRAPLLGLFAHFNTHAPPQRVGSGPPRTAAPAGAPRLLGTVIWPRWARASRFPPSGTISLPSLAANLVTHAHVAFGGVPAVPMNTLPALKPRVALWHLQRPSRSSDVTLNGKNWHFAKGTLTDEPVNV